MSEATDFDAAMQLGSVFVPGGEPAAEALARVDTMAIGAHQVRRRARAGSHTH